MPIQQLPQWVVVCAALLTPVIAILGVYIAWQQWRTNRNKLKFDLFERRYTFYEASMELIGSIQTTGVATDNAMLAFLVRTKGAQFIVGSDLAEYFDKELYRKAVELNGLESELKGLEPGPVRTQNIQRQREIKNWLSAQRDVLDKKFVPLLRLSH